MRVHSPELLDMGGIKSVTFSLGISKHRLRKRWRTSVLGLHFTSFVEVSSDKHTTCRGQRSC